MAEETMSCWRVLPEVDCNSVPPPLTITFNGVDITIDPKDLNQEIEGECYGTLLGLIQKNPDTQFLELRSLRMSLLCTTLKKGRWNSVRELHTDNLSFDCCIGT